MQNFVRRNPSYRFSSISSTVHVLPGVKLKECYERAKKEKHEHPIASYNQVIPFAGICIFTEKSNGYLIYPIEKSEQKKAAFKEIDK